MTIEAEASQAGILVISEAHYPGWTATVDGVAAPLLRTDYALRGVALGAGRHRVELTYVSRPVRTGLALGALGLVALAALAFVRRRP
jgi:uncharacterized membrane protein YfhO